MADEPEAGKKGALGRYFAGLTATGKFLHWMVAFLIGLLALWTAIKPNLPPSASVTFPVCLPTLADVQITNDGSSTATVGAMKFHVTVDGVTTERKMEAVTYEDQQGKEGAPTDPNQISSLAAKEARIYHFRTDGLYFRPEHESCEMTVDVTLQWGERVKNYPRKCPCQR